jgi:hypothetical protein
LREQLRGKIIRMGSHGMAVEFQTSELHLWWIGSAPDKSFTL